MFIIFISVLRIITVFHFSPFSLIIWLWIIAFWGALIIVLYLSRWYGLLIILIYIRGMLVIICFFTATIHFEFPFFKFLMISTILGVVDSLLVVSMRRIFIGYNNTLDLLNAPARIFLLRIILLVCLLIIVKITARAKFPLRTLYKE